MDSARRFTGKQLTAMVIAICTAVVLAPVGAMAVTGSFVSISDPVHKARKAHVTATGRLVTAPCDGNSCVAVDGAAMRVGGKVTVTDGDGALTVDGAVRPAAPAMPWTSTYEYDGTAGFQQPLAGPSASPIELTSLSVGLERVDVGMKLTIFGAIAPAGATNCTNLSQIKFLWQMRFAEVGQVESFPFPSPLEYRPTVGTKACLMVSIPSGLITTQLNATGFYAE